MYDEPARPSPIPAPIAPPARAIPPPTKAPASWTASSVTAIDLLSLVSRRGVAHRLNSVDAGPGGSVRWNGGRLGRSRVVVADVVVEVGQLLLVLLLEVLMQGLVLLVTGTG